MHAVFAVLLVFALAPLHGNGHQLAVETAEFDGRLEKDPFIGEWRMGQENNSKRKKEKLFLHVCLPRRAPDPVSSLCLTTLHLDHMMN